MDIGKIKVELGDRKSWTGYELEEIEMLEREEGFRETLGCMLDNLIGNGCLLDYRMMWGYNRVNPGSTFWRSGVDIMVNAWVHYDDYVYEYFAVTLGQMNDIMCNEDRRALAYNIYRRQAL